MQQVALKDKEGTEQAGEHCGVSLLGSDKLTVNSRCVCQPEDRRVTVGISIRTPHYQIKTKGTQIHR